jgi:F-type H+-transporting ATPase subunit a
MIINQHLSHSPLDQFTIRNLFSLKGDILGNIQISLTNMGLYLTITSMIIFLYYLLANNNDRITPNN